MDNPIHELCRDPQYAEAELKRCIDAKKCGGEKEAAADKSLAFLLLYAAEPIASKAAYMLRRGTDVRLEANRLRTGMQLLVSQNLHKEIWDEEDAFLYMSYEKQLEKLEDA